MRMHGTPGLQIAAEADRSFHILMVSSTLLPSSTFLQLRWTMSWNTNKTQQNEKNQNHNGVKLEINNINISLQTLAT